MYLKIISELGNIDELPTIPPILVQLNKVLADSSSCAPDVAKLIEEDQVLTTRILKLVNSAYYGYSRKITTVKQAVVIIGYRNIRNLVLTAKTFDVYKSCYRKVRSFFDINLLWKHSLGTAVIARNIGTIINYSNKETLFIGGLIHDIGKVVEFNCLSDYIPDIFKLVKDNNLSMWEAEQKLFHISHAEIGKVLGDMWDFPPVLGNMIAYHHYPHLAGEYSQEVAVVHIADYLCRVMDIGSGGDNVISVVEDNAWETADIPLDKVELIKEKSEREIEEVLTIFIT
ncbi:HDOD domain-containing protein [bacterium]|nr:HDOD domain-containing protein [bacterium]